MKKILVTQKLHMHQEYKEEMETLDSSWGLVFSEIDILPICLSINYDFRTYFNNMNIDGVIFTGGNDLYSCNSNELSKKRDIFEKALLKYCVENTIPIFGLCRGMQLISEYFGSTLSKVDGQVGIRHNLLVNKNSKYFRDLKKIDDVNSYHNYAVDKLSDELIISATDSNGVIKAIEHKNYKIFAQMWHSEREEIMDNNQLGLIKRFFEN